MRFEIEGGEVGVKRRVRAMEQVVINVFAFRNDLGVLRMNKQPTRR